MSEKKIVVPDFMVQAGATGFLAKGSPLEPMAAARAVLIESLRWLSETPIVPTDEQIERCGKLLTPSDSVHSYCRHFMVEWQRRCFLSPEPRFVPVTVTFPEPGIYRVEQDGSFSREGVDLRPAAPEPEGTAKQLTSTLEDCRVIIDEWLKKHQPNGSRIGLVGTASAQELLNALCMIPSPEPEVPEEIEDLLQVNAVSAQTSNERIIEAYRRGQRSGK